MEKKTMSDDVADEGLDPTAREFLAAFRCMSEEDQDVLARVVSVIGKCSRCGGLLNRFMPYLSYKILVVTHQEQPWLSSVNVQQEQVLAEICRSCEPCERIQEQLEESNNDSVNEHSERSHGAFTAPRARSSRKMHST